MRVGSSGSGGLPVPSEGPEPDVPFGLVVEVLDVVAPTALGGADAGPLGGATDSTGLAQGQYEKFGLGSKGDRPSPNRRDSASRRASPVLREDAAQRVHVVERETQSWPRNTTRQLD